MLKKGFGEDMAKEQTFYRPSCPICGQGATTDLDFCDEHHLQYRKRQRDGVDTEELDQRWKDTLDNWRERPSVLDSETGIRPLATALLFWRKYENLLLFIRHYDATDFMQVSRIADCLAIDVQTGGIRRFVEVSENDVLEDLQGIRPAPYQTELAPFWGSVTLTKFQEQLEQHFYDEKHQVRISEIVRAASFPIYGVVGNSLGLAIRSFCYGKTGYRLISITFIFSNPLYANGRKHVEIASFDAKERSIVHDSNISNNLHTNNNDWLLRRYHISYEGQKQISKPFLLKRDFTIGTVSFTGELWHCSQPYHISVFTLKNEKTVLSGSACGPSEQEIISLLEHLEPVNEHNDILTQYQHELDQETQKLHDAAS